ncbi:MAG: universal stress protein [Actinomycetota bacterium]|nr:universal stress protein [Actinomycetota bacterium]
MTTTQPRLSNIVVAVDGSPESFSALELAAVIGGLQQAAITVVHVREKLRAFSLGPAGAMEYAQAEDELDTLISTESTARMAGYSGTWTIEVRTGNVSHEVRAVADQTDADLVVVGHRSHSPVRDAILGSTASSIVHHSGRSVLVAVPPA